MALVGHKPREKPPLDLRELLTPAGLLLGAGALVGGWAIGNMVGNSVQQGELTLAPRDTTDADELVAFGGTVMALGANVYMTEGIIKEYGFEKVALYGGGYIAALYAIKAIRDR